MAVVPSTVRPQDGGSLGELREIAAATDAHLDVFLSEELRRWEAVDPELSAPLEALRQLVLQGGKRLRPAFCQWGFAAVGGDLDDERATAALSDTRSAFELLHAFALAHDDVMDDSSSRRGQPTTHVDWAGRHHDGGWRGEARRFGESVAILVGDLGHTYAHRLMAGKPAAVAEVWGELETELMLGQFLDVVGTATGGVGERTARHIAQLKSGRYTVARPLQVGAALAGDDRFPAALAEYGDAIGLAFQLRDDLLGVFGAEDDTGKPVGDDLSEGKPTTLLAIATRRADATQLAVLDQVGHECSPQQVSDIQTVLEDTGARDEVERLTLELTHQGVSAVTGGKQRGELVPHAADVLAEFAVVLCDRTS
jgi:geranylgeranyl diphosphate synthase, type I